MTKPIKARAVLLTACMLLAGCHHTTPPRQNVQITPPASPPPAVTPSQIPAPKTGVIYLVSDSGGDDNNLVPHRISLAHSQSPARDALQALIDADHSPLPDGTTLRGVKIADGLATVDFSREFQSHFHGSDTQEAQTVNSVLRTLGQFPSIDRVQILVDGKSIDALSQLPLNAPLDVIRPDSARAASARTGTARE